MDRVRLVQRTCMYLTPETWSFFIVLVFSLASSSIKNHPYANVCAAVVENKSRRLSWTAHDGRGRRACENTRAPAIGPES